MTSVHPVAARTDQLALEEVAEVLALAQAAGDTDGAYPLSEHVVLHLRHGGDVPAVHLLARDRDGALAGYAHLDTTDEVEGASAELVVHPLHRRHGLGRALVRAAMEVTEQSDPRGRLRLWAHGDHPSAGALALGLGFERARVLLQMRRSLFAPLPEARLPDGMALRAFRPGVDDEAWVALNARAFAGHPDQGRWTPHDLHLRMAEPWFDPDGFLLAVDERDGRLLGFHWTKVHGDLGHHQEHQHEPIGEVYVLGVDPAAHGTGLGSALTTAGLRYLRGRGLDQAMLYVDESNVRAVALYTRSGFARWSTDVSYRRLFTRSRQRQGDIA
ncbi:mycothiol synthase [Phytohabitans suffuscus]|uniref:Mycothiol acetyltransferase n=1 Tax=Phytohabitans suffuscus TaxID=624315 RepID=A0A6F8YHT4_9ACTN|nr:mycothiol synthase [Phytohabitans suffuscus]BCB85501.1 mycothiol acetyltransferase [Phytohabitans suffuscus]